MVQWEYKILELDEYDTEEVLDYLNELGKIGWENYHISTSLRTYFFRRATN